MGQCVANGLVAFLYRLIVNGTFSKFGNRRFVRVRPAKNVGFHLNRNASWVDPGKYGDP